MGSLLECVVLCCVLVAKYVIDCLLQITMKIVRFGKYFLKDVTDNMQLSS